MSLVGDVDPALRALAERMDHLSILASDVAAELGEYLAGLDADPARLMWVQDRRGELSRALREVGGPHEDLADVDALIAFAERAASRVAELDGPQDTDTALEEALARADRELGDLAARLSSARRDLAVTLEQRVSAELEGLEMRGARLVVDLEALEEPGPTGAESVSLLLSPHPGAAPLPVGRGASGGELSRIMLALEVVLADGVGTTGAGTGGETGRTGNGAGASAAVGPGANRHRRTFVFDEIDAGVGGRAAREIGRRLARLARRHQVVVVTHLPQVAAWADQHLVVVKEQEPEPQAVTDPIPDILQEPGGDGAADARPEPVRAPLLESRAPATAPGSPGVRTRVVAVEGRARVRELARMLSGHEDSRSALRHAAELLQEARVEESRT